MCVVAASTLACGDEEPVIVLADVQVTPTEITLQSQVDGNTATADITLTNTSVFDYAVEARLTEGAQGLFVSTSDINPLTEVPDLSNRPWLSVSNFLRSSTASIRNSGGGGNGFDFDLAGNETRKLRFELIPLNRQATSGPRTATLEFATGPRLIERVSITANVLPPDEVNLAVDPGPTPLMVRLADPLVTPSQVQIPFEYRGPSPLLVEARLTGSSPAGLRLTAANDLAGLVASGGDFAYFVSAGYDDRTLSPDLFQDLMPVGAGVRVELNEGTGDFLFGYVATSTLAPFEIDIEFTTPDGTVVDQTTVAIEVVTPPTVVEVTPADGTTGAAPSTRPQVRFSEDMDPSGGGLVSLLVSGQNLSLTTRWVQPDLLEIIPDADLPADATVDLVVVSYRSATGIRALEFRSTFRTAPAAMPQLIFTEDFEDPLTGWTLFGGWEAGVPTGGPSQGPRSGTQLAGTVLSGEYFSNQYTEMRLPALDLSALTAPTLEWYQWHDFGSGDGGTLQVSFDGGTSFTSVSASALDVPYDETLTGSDLTGNMAWTGTRSNDWVRVRADLGTVLMGQPTDRVVFNFIMASDGTDTGDGWYIDDIAVGDLGALGN